MHITPRFSGLTPLSGLTALSGLNGQHMLRYAVGATFVFIAAASVVALDEQRAWFHRQPTAVAASQPSALPPAPDATRDAQPQIVFDRVEPPKPTQFAAADTTITDASPAPVVADPPAPVEPPPVAAKVEPPVAKVEPPPIAKVAHKPVAKDLPPLTTQQTNAPVFDTLLLARQSLNHGDLDHAKALLVFLTARLGHEPAREDVTIAKTMLGDAVTALDDGDTERAVHKVNVATTCYTVHCPPPNAR